LQGLLESKMKQKKEKVTTHFSEIIELKIEKKIPHIVMYLLLDSNSPC